MAKVPDRPVDAPEAAVRAIGKKEYLRELTRLQVELVKQQEWIRNAGLKVVLVFEGRDAAGKTFIPEVY